MRSKIALCFMLTAYLFAVTARLPGETIVHSGFKEFSKGTFSGSGLNAYVSFRGRIQLINRLDLNNDGKVDILIGNGHAHSEKEDLFIYPNRGGDFDQRNRIEVPVDGGKAAVIADFNKDGKNDLAVAHRDNGITFHLNAFVYYQMNGSFPVSQRVELPAWSATALAAADFNGDGWVDLAFACENRAEKGTTSTVYWNSCAGFKEANKQEFTPKPLSSLASGDWNGDGISDLIAVSKEGVLIFCGGKSGLELKQTDDPGGSEVIAADWNRDGKIDYAVTSKDQVRIRFNGRPESDMKTISGLHAPSGLAAADFDSDGWLDLAVAQSNIGGNEYIDSLIIWNGTRGFDQRARTPLPTVAASCVAAEDLNGDHYPEVVFGNNHAYNELSIPSFVYWNSAKGFNQSRRSMLDTRGVSGVTTGDLDADGKPDLVFVNTQGGWSEGWNPNQIYWGDGTRNYSTARRTDVPGYYTTGTFQADIDDDGWVDVGFAEGRYAVGRPPTLHGLYVYLGSKNAYSADRRMVLSAWEAEGGTKVADLNRDGYLDLLSGGADSEGEGKGGFVLFWGGPAGYSVQRKLIFDTGAMCRAPLVADLNQDGYLDLAAAPYNVNGLFIFWGSKNGFDLTKHSVIADDRQVAYPDAADLNKDGFLDIIVPTRKYKGETEADSFVYYGSAQGFSERRRAGLPTMAGYDPSVADLNKDGWLDIVFPNYSATTAGKRSVATYIYWGSPQGFDRNQRLELPADSGAGSIVADFDGDGWIDLFIACHRKDGSRDQAGFPHRHTALSFIYWNGPAGFDPKNRTELPSAGPHSQMGIDPGNIMTRELAEYYTSPVLSASDGRLAAKSLTWEAETPFGTSVQFQVRSGKTEKELMSADWTGPKGSDSWYSTSGTQLSGGSGPWFQYRARLATPNGGPTPYLTKVVVEF